jgi:predicted regulator of Ras-like GTPase activity (Roadblock/LC7/MglB family)
MSAKDKLQELTNLEGFQGAAVFTPSGEELCVIGGSVTNMKEVGVLANNVLMNAQKASLEMGAGRGQVVHVEGEKAQILVRCTNEGTDPLKSQPGRAHIHTVLVLKPDASLGMAKLKLGQVVEKMAEDFR